MMCAVLPAAKLIVSRLALACLPLIAPLPAVAEGLSLQGDARMGIIWERPAVTPGSDRAEARLHARSRLKLKFEGQTDGGLRYGAEVELDTTPDRLQQRRVFVGN